MGNSDDQLSAAELRSVVVNQNDQIERLKRDIAQLRRDEDQALASRVSEVLRYLRMHQVILLNLGEQHGPIDEENLAAQAALRESFDLANAPVPAETIEQIRKAANGGMSRW